MRKTFWVAGTLAAIAVASSTKVGREEARERLARWNPLFILLDVVGFGLLALMLFGPRAS
jgi:hypothetical protein